MTLRHDVTTVSTEHLKQAAGLFHGEFLDGLDLPMCYRYQEWCMAEREAVSRLRMSVLGALTERLGEHPEEALPYARALAAADPLSEAGHAAVVRLLARSGRHGEALAHYEHARRILDTELGARPAAELEEARRLLTSAVVRSPAKTPVREPEARPAPSRASRPLFGRHAERAVIERALSATAARQGCNVMLVTGEPGIGKSRLLDHIADGMALVGGAAFGGRAFEAEAARPYGIWIDILRAIAREQPGVELSRGLGMLLPEVGPGAGDLTERSRLFDAVVDALRQTADERPTAILLDDVQWMDDTSSALLHYVARECGKPEGLLIACAARSGEIDDNAAVSSVIRSLSRDGRLQEIALDALSADETAHLVRTVNPALEPAGIFAQSAGNPLFTLELARSYDRGDTGPGRTVETVIAGQLAPLSEQARDLLVWAAAHGRDFTPEILGPLAGLDGTDLLAALWELERRGLVRPLGDDAYDFTHDLVRQAAYRSLSQPRRKLVHRHIAQSLKALVENDSAVAADLARHAELAGEREVAAHASILAGERALRLFANAEASGFAERGLSQLDGLPDGPAKVEARIALLKLRIFAAMGPGMRSLPPLVETVAEAVRAAEALGLRAAAATGHYLLSVLHQESGDTERAQTSTLRAAEAGRSADDATGARQLANTARCLLELDAEIGRSRTLIREAGLIAAPLGIELCELYWAEGLLQRWDGEAGASASIERALVLARAEEDRWREYRCLTWLAMLALEDGRYADTLTRCTELTSVAERLGEDETPFIAMLQALALAAGGHAADEELTAAFCRLRAIDDKSYLAYALNSVATVHLRQGRDELARASAAEALAIATIMRRRSEIVVAHSLLARTGDEASAREVESLVSCTGPQDLSVRARSSLLAAARALGISPTVVPMTGG